MATVLYDNPTKGETPTVVIIVTGSEVSTMIDILAAGIVGKKFTKQSKAYKLAMAIEDKFPLI